MHHTGWTVRGHLHPESRRVSGCDCSTRVGAHGRLSVCERIAIRQSRKAIANITAPHTRSDTSRPMASARRLLTLLASSISLRSSPNAQP